MLQAVRSARSARRARSACEKVVFPNFFSNLRLVPEGLLAIFQFLKMVCRARRRGFLLEEQAMLQAVQRAQRAGREARARKKSKLFLAIRASVPEGLQVF